MRNKLFALMSLLLAAALLLPMAAGCQTASSPTVSPTTTEESIQTKEPANTEASPAAASPAAPITFTAFVDYPTALTDTQWGNDPVSQKIAELTGVTINVSFATTSDGQELSAMMASGQTLPDFLVTNANGTLAYSLYKQGFVQSLTKLAQQYSPDFFTCLPKDEEKFYARDDGDLYCTVDWYGEPESLAKIDVRTYNAAGIMIHKPTYEALGSPSVKTLEDFKALLLQVKEKYSQFIFILYMQDIFPVNMLQNIYGGTNKYIVRDDGTLQSAYTSESFKNALLYINDLYQAGLINPENFTQQYAQYQQVSANGQIFAHFGYTWEFANQTKSLNDDAPYVAVDLPEAPGISSESVVLPDERLAIGGAHGVHISVDCKSPDRAIQYITFMLSKQGQLLQRCGIEEKDYVMDEQGYPNRTQSRRDVENNEGWAVLNQKLGIQSDLTAWFISQETCCLSEKYWTCEYKLYNDLSTLYKGRTKDTRVIDLAANVQQEEYKIINTQITEYWNKTSTELYLAKDDATFEATYDTFLQNLDKLGLPKLETYVTQVYQQWQDKLK